MTDLSVIIVNWNTRDLLLQCLASLQANESSPEREIIVVDNNSSDGSAEAVQREYPEVVIVQNSDNLGFARANNIGMEQSRGRYICLSNSDIKVLDDALIKMVGYMDDHPRVGVLAPKTLNADGSLRMNCQNFPSLRQTLSRAFWLHRLFPRTAIFRDVLMSDFDHDSVRSVEVLPGCFLMVRREALAEVGMLDENFFFYGEDKDWCRRFHKHGWDAVFLPDARVIHYAGKSAAAAPVRFMIEQLRSQTYYWKKHHSPVTVPLLLLILTLHHAFRFLAPVAIYPLRPEARETLKTKIKGHGASVLWLIRQFAIETAALFVPSRKAGAASRSVSAARKGRADEPGSRS